jgi:hypothetical protein
MRGRCPVCIYARNRPRFANLLKMLNPDTKLLEKYFSYFTKNFRMSNLYVKLLEKTRKLLLLLESRDSTGPVRGEGEEKRPRLSCDESQRQTEAMISSQKFLGFLVRSNI